MQTVHLIPGLVVLLATAALAAPSEAERIEAALKKIETSNVVFIRNGDEHEAKKAAGHLRSKLKGTNGKVKTFDEFVDHLATKSSMSGKPYLVRLTDGAVVPLAKWLREQDALAAAPPPAAGPAPVTSK